VLASSAASANAHTYAATVNVQITITAVSCAEGMWSETGSSPCKAWSVCVDPLEALSVPTLTHDRSCGVAEDSVLAKTKGSSAGVWLLVVGLGVLAIVVVGFLTKQEHERRESASAVAAMRPHFKMLNPKLHADEVMQMDDSDPEYEAVGTSTWYGVVPMAMISDYASVLDAESRTFRQVVSYDAMYHGNPVLHPPAHAYERVYAHFRLRPPPVHTLMALADDTELFLAAALASDPDLLDRAVEFVARAMTDVIVDRAIDLFALAEDSSAVDSAGTSNLSAMTPWLLDEYIPAENPLLQLVHTAGTGTGYRRLRYPTSDGVVHGRAETGTNSETAFASEPGAYVDCGVEYGMVDMPAIVELAGCTVNTNAAGRHMGACFRPISPDIAPIYAYAVAGPGAEENIEMDAVYYAASMNVSQLEETNEVFAAEHATAAVVNYEKATGGEAIYSFACNGLPSVDDENEYALATALKLPVHFPNRTREHTKQKQNLKPAGEGWHAADEAIYDVADRECSSNLVTTTRLGSTSEATLNYVGESNEEGVTVTYTLATACSEATPNYAGQSNEEGVTYTLATACSEATFALPVEHKAEIGAEHTTIGCRSTTLIVIPAPVSSAFYAITTALEPVGESFLTSPRAFYSAIGAGFARDQDLECGLPDQESETVGTYEL
jgi:hypothetical protein